MSLLFGSTRGPVDQIEQEHRVCTKSLNLLSFGSHDASGDGLLVNIQTASTLDQDIHNIHLSTAIEIEDWCNNQKRITLIEGEEDPEKLAAFARRTLKKKKEELELALRGNMSAHQRIMLKTMLTHVDFLNEQILELDTEVAKRLDPFQQDIERHRPAYRRTNSSRSWD
jgi:hypothetical protein